MYDYRYRYDSINAVVCDMGSQSFRVGYARHLVPTVEIAASVGVPTAAVLEPGVKRDGSVNKKYNSRNFDVDVTSLSVPREDVELDYVIHKSERYLGKYTKRDFKGSNLSRNSVEMVNCTEDGMIDDWDLFEELFDYAFINYVRSDPRNHPLMFTEPSLNYTSKREKLAELMFEKYDVPSMYLCADAVLAMFALCGCFSTAIVIDSGATHTTVAPINRGYVMDEFLLESPLGGNFITSQCKQFFYENGIDIVPRYMIEKMTPVKPKENPIWSRKITLPEVTTSWNEYMCDLVIQDFQKSVLQVPKRPYDEKRISAFPTFHYEFPNGYNQEFGDERIKIPETLFAPNSYVTGYPMSLGQMVNTCIEMCDEDLRETLYKNIIVVGGNSLLKGFASRLSEDVSANKPISVQLRMVTPIRPTDRQYSAWLGGSMIATAETSEDLWFSRQEYKEYGKSYIDFKCPY